jgi:RHS repeat-associated protein
MRIGGIDVYVDAQQSAFVTDEVLWALTDHLGTVRDLAVYNSGTWRTTVVNHRVYDAFGNMTSETNAAGDCIFGFTGLMFDEATGLNFSRTRPHEARTARWLGEDWLGLGAGPNPYAYCGNSPLTNRDPSGMCAEDADGGAAYGARNLLYRGRPGGFIAAPFIIDSSSPAMWSYANFSNLLFHGDPGGFIAGPHRPSDLVGVQLWAYANYSDLVYRGGPNEIAVGPHRESDFAGQQTWMLASAPRGGERRTIHGKEFYWATLPDGVKTWLPVDSRVFYYADGSYEIRYADPNAAPAPGQTTCSYAVTYTVVINTGKPDPNAAGSLRLYGETAIGGFLSGMAKGFWDNFGAPFIQGGLDLANGVTDLIVHVDNAVIFVANAGMEVINAVSEMSNYRKPIFNKPIPYYKEWPWARDLIASEPDWIYKFNTLTGEFLTGIGIGRLFGAVGEAGSAAAKMPNDIIVSHWGSPSLESGGWVMEGRKTPWNYIWSGKWQPWDPIFRNEFAPYGSGQEFLVPAPYLEWPGGVFGPIKGALGQRIYVGPSIPVE